MRHRKRGRTLGRNAAHRKAMFRNMANSLFEHEEIVTTVAKAKELRPFAEKMITLARRCALANRDAAKIREKTTGLAKDSTERAELLAEWRQANAPVLHVRRMLISRLGNHRIENDEDHDTIIQKLINTIGPRYLDRPGGYTRILKLTKRRLGDAGHQAMISLVTDDGSSPRKRGKQDEAETKEPVAAGAAEM
jgi:large subunit ribosomal protein L17